MLRTLCIIFAFGCFACSSDDDSSTTFAPHHSGVLPRDGGTESDAAAPADNGSATGPMQAGAPTGNNRFSPSEVYLSGTLQEGACYRDAIANVLSPNKGLVGFTCYSQHRQIDPTTGDLLYLETTHVAELRAFRCDNGCRYWSKDDKYPEDPVHNDATRSLPKCTTGDMETDDFKVGPDGNMVFFCDGHWHDEKGRLLSMADGLMALGHDMLGLGRNGAGVNYWIYDMTADSLTPVMLPLVTASTVVVRASDHGFHVAIVQGQSDDLTSLWEFDASGTATMLGEYPPPPADHRVFLGDGWNALTPDDALVQIAQTPTDTIIRRSLKGESEEIYNEDDDPIVKIHISNLVTGP